MGGIFMKSPVVKRSIVLAGHKTSVSLEDAFWNALKEIARKRLMTLSDLVGTIDSQRQQGNLSSALRLFVLEFYRSQIPEEGRQGPHEMMDHPEPLTFSGLKSALKGRLEYLRPACIGDPLAQ
jgi:predicted DNA-binding ribbon-helix-helix protein